MGKFKEYAQDLENHIPMGILDQLLQHRGHNHPNGVFINGRICSWVDEAKQDFPRKKDYVRLTTPEDHLPSGNGETIFMWGKYSDEVEKFYEKWFSE